LAMIKFISLPFVLFFAVITILSIVFSLIADLMLFASIFIVNMVLKLFGYDYIVAIMDEDDQDHEEDEK
jgi:cell division protein FtsX